MNRRQLLQAMLALCLASCVERVRTFCWIAPEHTDKAAQFIADCTKEHNDGDGWQRVSTCSATARSLWCTTIFEVGNNTGWKRCPGETKAQEAACRKHGWKP